MNKLLIIIDMQNDFIDGSLANPDAQAIVEPMARLIESWSGDIIFTMDTHDEDYLETMEGKHLPVKHCIIGTEGWRVNQALYDASLNFPIEQSVDYILKPTFGYKDWDFETTTYDEIYLCGTCTDICVVSNALVLKAKYPEIPIRVYGNLCAGVTKEKHEAALEVMKSCQVEVMDCND